MTAQQLINDVVDLVNDPQVAGLSVRSVYRALGLTLTPPAGTISPGGKAGDGQGIFELPDGTKGVTIDSWGSQARRWSNAVAAGLEEAGLPAIEFYADLGQDGPQMLPNSSWTWSHKHADALFRVHAKQVRDEGVDYDAIAQASAECADALLQWFPNSIVTGWWNSHSGKAATGAPAKAKGLGLPDPSAFAGSPHASKSARVMVSEIVAKGVALRTRYAARVDPVFGAMPAKAGGTGKGKLSELGFGSIPPSAAPKDVTFESVEGSSWVSFTRLRAFGFETFDADRARAAMVLLALYGLQRGVHDLHLRSGTDLILDERTVTLERHGAGSSAFDLPDVETLAQALRIFADEFGWQRIRVDLSSSSNLKHLLSKAEEAGDDSDEE